MIANSDVQIYDTIKLYYLVCFFLERVNNFQLFFLKPCSQRYITIFPDNPCFMNSCISNSDIIEAFSAANHLKSVVMK